MTFQKYQSGFTVIEIIAAMALLTVCIVGFAKLAAFVSLQRSAEITRQSAVDHLQNVFEQLADQPAEKLIALDFDKSDYEQTAQRAVRDGQITFSCEPAAFEGDFKSYLFQATVSWSRGSKPRGEASLFRLLTAAPSEPKGETEQ